MPTRHANRTIVACLLPRTRVVLGGNYDEYVPPGDSVKLKGRLTLAADTPAATPHRLVVAATSAGDPAKVDVVRAVADR